jgi:phytoene desaturase
LRIVVIGSGFGGLSAAIRLRAQGHDVTILEKLDKPGGRAYVFERDGFTFDAGPTILTAPHLIDELFALGGRDRRDYVPFVQLDPAYNVRFEDGSVFHYHTDTARLRAEVARFAPDDVRGYDAFAKETSAIFRAGMALIDKPFGSIGAMVAALPQLVRLRADRSVTTLVDRHFRDPRLRQVFSFHPLLVGGNPATTTSIYALIHKLELEWGVWFAMGGTGALVRALVRRFGEMGGRIEYGQTVTEIVVPAGSRRATGVRLGTRDVRAADAIVSNADVATTYTQLLPARARRKWTDARIARQRYSMSLFVLYFGTTRQYPEMAHHEILMGPRYRDLLSDVFDRQVLATDFSLYLHRPTATDPSLAPPGHDAWYALAPVPHLGSTTDWAIAGPRYRDSIVRYLEDRYLPGLSAHIVSESVVDPRYFRDELAAYHGSGFSFQPTFGQSAWFRPHNHSEDVENLYFAGAGTHPGAGVPGVISSGKIVANLIGQSNV